jgi:hypothetical protein
MKKLDESQTKYSPVDSRDNETACGSATGQHCPNNCPSLDIRDSLTDRPEAIHTVQSIVQSVHHAEAHQPTVSGLDESTAGQELARDF